MVRFAGGRMRHVICALTCVLLVALVAGCGLPLKHLNDLYDANSQTKWYYRSAPNLHRDNPYVENATPDQIVDVYAQVGTEPAPVLIFVHGGAWQSGTAKDYAALAKTFHHLGWVLFVPTYRKYPEVTYPAFADDTVAALNWSMEHIADYGGDPDRVILAGHSAGAHLVAYVLTDEDFRKKMTFDPMHLRGAVPLSGAFDFTAAAPHLEKLVHDAMGTPEGWEKAQPIHHVRGDVPPMLIMIGEKDKLTPAYQARDFATRMKEAGADARYVELPGGDHYSIVIEMLEGHEGPALARFMEFVDDVFASREPEAAPALEPDAEAAPDPS